MTTEKQHIQEANLLTVQNVYLHLLREHPKAARKKRDEWEERLIQARIGISLARSRSHYAELLEV